MNWCFNCSNKEKEDTIEVHLYSPKIRLGRADSANNYKEIDKSEVK